MSKAAEKYLEKKEGFIPYDEEVTYPITRKRLAEIIEAYHRKRVKAITKVEILRAVNELIFETDNPKASFMEGIRWYKSELLKG